MIEGLVFMLSLVLCVILVMIVGAAFYNHVVLSTTAENMSLTAQSIMDEGCSPNSTDGQCQAAQALAEQDANNILYGCSGCSQAGAASTLIGMTVQKPVDGNGFDIQRETTTPISVPTQNGPVELSSPGWGYAHITLRGTYYPLGNGGSGATANFLGFSLPVSGVSISAGSLTASYRTPGA
jgi:hypothetical protein